MGEINNRLTPSEKTDKIEQVKKGVIRDIFRIDSEGFYLFGKKLWIWRKKK